VLLESASNKSRSRMRMEEYRQFNQSASIPNRNQSSGNDIGILGLSGRVRPRTPTSEATSRDVLAVSALGAHLLTVPVAVSSRSTSSATVRSRRVNLPHIILQLTFQPYLPPSAGNRPRIYPHLNRPSHVAADHHSGCPRLTSTPPPTSRTSNTLYRGRQTAS